ncbi:DUF2931 family protein [Vibrio aestuarianus]|uniref:DUF2931 family protein n=2 Tax=Vibrio TaxID=662 RepID=A0A9X4FHL0_9VIBR|nr:DUF2931 family protein [Vibrio aestuarianus]MDE1237008.1 DUF2931 family protein [Vibrio aestuarianus]MDE1247906.1 DUF2931 family protein [Vibrio aestuarianus]MDE1348321.1 DUF2931 family protein [Vibrio aestuarianus]NGZ65227.1 DUF2931 family protein [Vibrio aestuarianus subsp. cardii]
MYLKSISVLLITVLLNACSSYAGPIPEKAWSVSVSMPTFYPVSVTQAYGVNDAQDWTSPLHAFSQFMRISAFENIKKELPDYDGFGLPIHPFAMNRRGDQVMRIKLPPDTLYLYWVSLINTQFYVTKYTVSEDVKSLMAQKSLYQNRDGSLGNVCYRTEFVFGLLPNGQAKVWLRGCGEIIYLTELAPDKVMDRDSHGFGAEKYKQPGSSLERIHQRAKDAGVLIDPIPWDKVNKVYSMEEIKPLN